MNFLSVKLKILIQTAIQLFWNWIYLPCRFTFHFGSYVSKLWSTNLSDSRPHGWLVLKNSKISRSKESLWWLVNLTLHRLNFTWHWYGHKCYYFISRGENSQNFGQKIIALRYLYEPPIIHTPTAMIRLHKTLFNYYKTRDRKSLFRVRQHFAL